MKFALVLLVLTTFGFSLLGPSRPASQQPVWLDDLDAAFELARASERPLLLVFR